MFRTERKWSPKAEYGRAESEGTTWEGTRALHCALVCPQTIASLQHLQQSRSDTRESLKYLKSLLSIILPNQESSLKPWLSCLMTAGFLHLRVLAFSPTWKGEERQLMLMFLCTRVCYWMESGVVTWFLLSGSNVTVCHTPWVWDPGNPEKTLLVFLSANLP